MAVPSRLFLIASVPAALISIYNLGFDLTAGHWLVMLGLSLVLSRFWAELFSRWRGLPRDSGWILTAWIFALLLPASTPIGFAALALSFGLVFGCHVFGGTGRYLVNPALLGVVFLAISYPSELAPTQTHPEQAIASLLGATFLIAMRTASARLLGGALAAIIAGSLASGLPWHTHLMLGHFAFVLAFVATDPTTRPATAGGCWTFGALFGVLTIMLRTLDPAQPEGSLPALLLASLCVPLLDYVSRYLPLNALRASQGRDS